MPCTAVASYPGAESVTVYVSVERPVIEKNPLPSVVADWRPVGDTAVTETFAAGAPVPATVIVPEILPVVPATAGTAQTPATKTNISKTATRRKNASNARFNTKKTPSGCGLGNYLSINLKTD